MGAKHWSAAALAALLTLSACNRADQVSTASPTTGGTVATIPAPSTVPPITVPPTTAPATTAPATTAAATTAPPTTATPTTPPTTPSTTPPPSPTDRVAVVQWGSMPIGVWDGAAWRDQEWGADNLPTFTSPIPEVVLAGLGLPAPVPGASHGPLDYFCVGDEQTPTVVEPPGFAPPDGGSWINVTADWNVQPRPVTQAGAENPEYQALGESRVDTSTGANPAEGDVTQAVRADLDGDGIEEVLLTFERASDDNGFGAAGDFTVVIARYPRADGSVDDTVLWSFYEEAPVDFPTPGTGSLVAVADLNGDGVMEVVVEQRYWEANIAEIYTLVNGRLAMVAGGGCGV